MTDYWVSTEKYFCEDCKIWINAKLKKHHNSTAIHQDKARMRERRDNRKNRMVKSHEAKAYQNLLLLEAKASENKVSKNGPSQRAKSNPSIGPVLPARPSDPNEQPKGPGFDKSSYEKFYHYFYNQYLTEESEKAKKEELTRMDVEAQVQVDVERKIKALLGSGMNPQSISLDDLLKLDGGNVNTVIQPPPPLQPTRKDAKSAKTKEKDYYNDPNFFYRMESEDYYHKKKEEEEKNAVEKSRNQKKNKVKNKKLEKEWEKQRKRMEKKKYYAQFENDRDTSRDGDTGLGQWEDVEEEVEEEEDSILGKRERVVNSNPQKFMQIQKKRKLDHHNQQKKCSVGRKGGNNNNTGSGIKISFIANNKPEVKKVVKKRKNVFD